MYDYYDAGMSADDAGAMRGTGAIISPDRDYRYALWRWWDFKKPYVLFIGLNPSTADENIDDPTIRRCRNFAKGWGYGGMYMVNLFAIRTSNPKIMRQHNEPVGIDNDVWLRTLAISAGKIICAWGVDGDHLQRNGQIIKLLADQQLYCLGVTKNGHPRHPLYLKSNIVPQLYVNPTN